MGVCPNCGNWVDDGDICQSCGGSGSYSESYCGVNEVEDDETCPVGNSKANEYSEMAWDLYMEFNDEDALYYINKALELQYYNANNLNRKAIILESLKRYGESEFFYNQSLRLSPKNLVYDNKARMLYDWASDLREKSKELPNGLKMLEDAKRISIRAIHTLPGEHSEENIEKYLKLKDSIDFYIGYEKKFHKNLETLKNYSKEELFTITGTRFYKNRISLTEGMDLRLVKEPDNEFDSKAIAVYAGDEKLGYVANKDYTKYELTSSASEIYDKIGDVALGKYLFYMDRYAPIQFNVGRIVKK